VNFCNGGILILHHPEIVKLEVIKSIEGIQKTVTQRLLPAFDSIKSEAEEKERNHLERYSRNFDPDTMDEGCTFEDAFFEGLDHLFTEELLKQEFLNSTVTWIFHLFEKQKKSIFGTDKSDVIVPKLKAISINLDSDNNWKIVNKELRHLANTVKHGMQSDSANELAALRSDLIIEGELKVTLIDIEKYINALKGFWNDYFRVTVIT
jgi:hypothetical protein